MLASQICQQCGACCAHYRVSFYWGESHPETGGTVPPDLTERLTPFRVIMKGTGVKPPRCVALDGTIGNHVACSIHTIRASTCREFGVRDVDGRPVIHAGDIERCNTARKAWGIPPLDLSLLHVVDEDGVPKEMLERPGETPKEMEGSQEGMVGLPEPT